MIDRARVVLATASALHVLEPDDLVGHGGRPEERLGELLSAGVLDDALVAALEALLESKAAPAPATVAPARRGTLSPERPGGRGSGPRRRATLSPAREPSAQALPGTVVAERAPTRRAGHESAPRIDPDDVSALPAELREAIGGAAFARLVVRAGALKLSDLSRVRSEASAAEARLEDHLLASGLVDPLSAMGIFTEVQVARPTCVRCLQPLSVKTCAPDEVEGEEIPLPDLAPERLSSGTVIGEELIPADLGAPAAGASLGDYTLLERIGEGGMGVVFRAQDRRLNRPVALKVMRAGPLASAMRRQRFLQEAEAVAALHHKNVVPIHQIGEIQGYPFYTMDYVAGSTLDTYVAGANPPPEAIASLVRQVAEGVHHFHSRGIIHRDLKPANVLVNAEGTAQIIDFGIAKKVESDEGGSWTIEGDLLGTPHYMSPEQAAGRNDEVDIRSDIYSVGTILYELLAGAPPFHDLPSHQLVEAIQEDEPRSLRAINPDVDADLSAIVGMAMAKEPDRRYASALELTQDLARYVANEPIHARPATVRYRLRKFLRRRRRAVAMACVAASLLLGVGVYLFAQEHARRSTVDDLLRAAVEAPLADRPDLFSQVLGLDPGNAVARLQREVAQRELEHRRQSAEQRRLGAERVKRERALIRVQQLEREQELARARRAVEAAQARERARAEARTHARRAAEQRAQTLLAEAQAEPDRLKQIALLDQALLLVTDYAGRLRDRVAQFKLRTVVQLARRAVAAEQVGLTEYWLHQASGLAPNEADKVALAAIRSSVLDLVSGKQLHESARRLIRRRDWLGAREKLRQASARGYQPTLVAQDMALVARRCEARAQQLAEEARRLLSASQPLAALGRTRMALRYASGSELALIGQLREDCAGAVARAAQARCLDSLDRPEQRSEAMAVLARASRTLAGTVAGRGLERELRHRTRLLRGGAHGLVYVPSLLELSPFTIQRTEVTNRDYAAFVSAGGYQEPGLFDKPARRLLPTFVDETKKPGPRTWRDGGFGDTRNGSRPVRGVTWYEARAYARWLSRRTQQTWRLPTAAEWEAAAGWDPKTQRLRVYPWGPVYDRRLTASHASQPLPVGSAAFDRSPLGLFDVGGSVCEWVRVTKDGQVLPRLKGSRYAADPREAEYAAQTRASGRPGANPPRELSEWVGFRLVREVQE